MRIPAAGFFCASQELMSELLLRALKGCKKMQEVMALIMHHLTCLGECHRSLKPQQGSSNTEKLKAFFRLEYKLKL